jgi:hypothetical protein
MREVLATHLKNKLDVVLEQLRAGQANLPTGSTR